MRRLIRESTPHPAIRRHTERAVEGLPPGQPLEEIRAVYEYVANITDYRRDPYDVEQLVAPWSVLECTVDQGRRPQLDCDDLTMLSLSMLGSIGFPTVIRVVSTRQDGQYNHVYGLAEVGEYLVPLDLTRARQDPDAPRRPEMRAFEVPV